MDREDRLAFILDHYHHPRKKGSCEDANIIQKGGNPECGDSVVIFIKTDDEGLIEDICFTGEGCIISQAATSVIMEMLDGKHITEIERINQNAIIELFGKELAITRPRCITLGLSTLKKALRKWKTKHILIK